MTVQTEAFTSPSLSFGSWRLAAVLGGATFSDNGGMETEHFLRYRWWKPVAGSAPSVQQTIPGSKLLSFDSMVTAFRRAAYMKCRVLFKLFCELLYTKPLGFGRSARGGGTNVYLCAPCCVEYNFVHCSYCLVCGDGTFQNSNYWFHGVFEAKPQLSIPKRNPPTGSQMFSLRAVSNVFNRK